jgi:phosphoenolpyruvate phosphomutase
MRVSGAIAAHALRTSLWRPAPPPVLAIGAVNAIAAKIAGAAGFEALWVSGLEVSASLGLPDANVLSPHDLQVALASVRAVTDIPVIVDIDNAGGSVDAARRYGRTMWQGGAAAVCVEDSAYPKCNSFSIGRAQALAELELTVSQLGAIREEAGEELVVIARTESLICGSGLPTAMHRAQRLAEGGADAILIHSKDPTGNEALEVARRWRRPEPLVVIPTAFPGLTWEQLGDAGFRLCIYANQLSRASMVAMQSTAAELLASGRPRRPEDLGSVDALIRVGDPRNAAYL